MDFGGFSMLLNVSVACSSKSTKLGHGDHELVFKVHTRCLERSVIHSAICMYNFVIKFLLNPFESCIRRSQPNLTPGDCVFQIRDD